MIYKVPCPSAHNGVKLYTLPNQQIGIEYSTGEPHVTMAYDSALGKPARTVTFRQPRYGRDDLPKGTGISRSKGEMNPRGSMNINDQDPDEDDGSEVVDKLMSYLAKYLDPEQLEGVALILGSADAPDSDAGEPRAAADRGRRQASDRGLAGRQERQAALDADFARMFPDALKVLRR